MKFSFAVKALTVSVLLASSGLALAGANYKGEPNLKGEVACPVPTLRDGLYIGAQGGYDSYKVRQDVDFTGVAVRTTTNATGGVGGLFVGYGLNVYDMFYVGAEVFGNYSGADVDNSTTITGVGSLHNKFHARGAWGVSALPGIKVNPALLVYARLGYDWSNLKSEETGPGFSRSKSNTSGGFNYGAGVEALVMDNWSVRAEYTHTDYDSFNSTIVHVKPEDNQFMGSVIYHLNWMM